MGIHGPCRKNVYFLHRQNFTSSISQDLYVHKMICIPVGSSVKKDEQILQKEYVSLIKRQKYKPVYIKKYISQLQFLKSISVRSCLKACCVLPVTAR